MSRGFLGEHFAGAQAHREYKAVSIGGGTGQPNAIRALHRLGYYVSAVVSMVDDGGSTGIIRERAGIVPPGDVRKCLSAMAKDPEDAFAKAFEHRFTFADNHTLGNLMLTALTEESGSFVEAIKICARQLNIHGMVLPSTLENVKLQGKTIDGVWVEGEFNLGKGQSALEEVWLDPPFVQAYPAAVQAILEADVIVLGPGSLFTSVIPNLLIPGIIDAIRQSDAKVIFVCSMADMQGETWGLSAFEHVHALMRHGMKDLIDVALIHRVQVQGLGIATRSFEALTGEQIDSDRMMRERISSDRTDGSKGFIRPVIVDDEIISKIKDEVPLVLVRDFSTPDRPTWHNPKKLADVLKGVIDACHLPQK